MKTMHRAVVAVVLALVGIFDFAHAGHTEVTGITASANGWDTRVHGIGCSPNGCVPANVLDNSIEPESRWSCKAALADIDVCELTLEFDAPHDIVQMKMALYRGNKRTRSVNVWVDGVLQHTIKSSGSTTDFETYQLVASDATTVMLQEADMDHSGWLSITEASIFYLIASYQVKFMEIDVSPTSPSMTMQPSCAPTTTFVPVPSPSPTISDDDSTFTPTASTSPPTVALPPTLQYAGLPDIVFDAVLDDAPYGLANGVIIMDQYDFVLYPEDNGIVNFSGTVNLFNEDEIALAESITLYYYVYNDLDDPVTSFVRGQGEVNSSTGVFSAAVTVPNGKSEVALVFVVLDEADRTTNLYPDTVHVSDVLNDCGESYFTITLEEWDNEEVYLYMTVYEPSGSEGSSGSFLQIGIILSEAFGVYGAQTYRLFNGLSIDQHDVLGDYEVNVIRYHSFTTEKDTNWNVTVRVAGEVVQEVTGVFAIAGESTSSDFVYNLESYMSSADC